MVLEHSSPSTADDFFPFVNSIMCVLEQCGWNTHIHLIEVEIDTLTQNVHTYRMCRWIYEVNVIWTA